jgi:hypothetical protein
MVPHVKDHNPLGTQKTVSLIFEKDSNTQNRILQLLNRRDVAEILPKRRKTLINQSILVLRFIYRTEREDDEQGITS